MFISFLTHTESRTAEMRITVSHGGYRKRPARQTREFLIGKRGSQDLRLYG